MAESMIEKVARAICASDFLGDNDVWAKLSPAMQGNYCDNARAAIEAMREPTMFMLRSADNAIISDERFESGPFESDKFTWETMIDAALAEQQS
ncbi:hypothetical protein EET67_05300 [Pseudaminobacter arsenicus]|uniref:Uncharacterized protein n=1 Tax=Borborobacter arsenicus TaxID=1851146 RepID=A0A432VA31_9HYPH|nr:hypothetical protein [Pseudaminobacter arsenicus]RUM99052.1 hypothetical protein EET67_05300 [Pseudaminobacter arsenicus]